MSHSKEYHGCVDTEYLQTVASGFGFFKSRTYELMRVQTGQTVLDVGCGPGIDTVALGILIGPSGKVFGIDLDPEMIVAAHESAKRQGMEAWVHHQQADASSLPFDSDGFDGVRSECTFQHLADPEKVLYEMIRVTKPGGWIVVLDTDHSSFTVDTVHKEIEWKIRRHRPELLRNGYSGRELYGLFKKANVQNVTYEVHASSTTDFSLVQYVLRWHDAIEKLIDGGIVTAVEAAAINSELEQRNSKGTFFCYGTFTIVTGRKG
ncbi:methyltransferase domain-containing protein [Fodinisporobacter ferrooxydans]|uniref:Methyltransferase domain-containing protein n=1 Tax=Fodinisporobacter ferrooxydans TaxID=2901836 RepID=A0ABY4CNZ7_9BACL|nr:methyltransferase domain-containing protein [Alicyclobacillaceae bacterium MYW30-H2]